MSNPWNTTMELVLEDIYINDILNFYKKLHTYNHMKRKEIVSSLIDEMNEETIPYIQSIYDSGYGYKVIARSMGITYSVIRNIFKYLNINVRTGYDVSTEKTRQFRSDRVKGDKNPWLDWTQTHAEMHKTSKRGVQGYYTKKDGSLIWLRSTWEYIYAKWLDKNDVNWGYESIQYNLNDGVKYRPDFNILDNDGKLVYVVEIKGYYKNRAYKVDMMKIEHPEIQIEMIEDISKYTSSSYKAEVKEWKNIKLSKQE